MAKQGDIDGGQQPRGTAKPARGWQANYARHCGCDRSHICRLVKRGMPTSSTDSMGGFAEADRWRLENASEGVGHKSGGRAARDSAAGMLSPADVDIAAGRAVEERDSATLASLLERVRRCEEMAGKALEVCLAKASQRPTRRVSSVDASEIRANAASSLPGLQRNHSAAVQALLRVEERVDELRKARADVARLEYLQEIIERRLKPIACMLESIPVQWAAKVNPDKPRFAQNVLAKECAAARRAIDAAWTTPIPPPSENDAD